MTDYVSELRSDLDFLLGRWLRSSHYDEIARSTLDLAADLARDAYAPHGRIADTNEPRLEADGVKVLPEISAALKAHAEAGFPAMTFDTALGGLGMAPVIGSAAFTLFASANIAISAYTMLSAANARLLADSADARLVEAFALPQIEGRWLGTMCLSEPQAGSSLADVRTRATPDGNDALGSRYRLAGNKMWISGADHDASENIVHLVLARLGDEPGTAGLSLFVVPKLLPDGQRNDVAVAGLNHKLGYRGIPNCALNFGEGRERPDGAVGAVGWIVGEPGEGLRIMFRMMNEARIGVGLGAAALAHRGYRQSLAYARERTQGRAGRDPLSPPVAIVEHPDVRRMLLRQKVYAEGSLALTLYCATLLEGNAADEELLALLTPTAKSWPSEWGCVANDLAIQIHGGYGYTRDYDVERLWRDNRLNPIHEGTTGIQAIDFVGRKVVRSDGAALGMLFDRIASDVAEARKNGFAYEADVLERTAHRVRDVLDGARNAPDPTIMANATALHQAVGHLVVGWLWLSMAIASDGDDAADRGRRHACRFFVETELPLIDAWLVPVESRSTLTNDVDPNIL